MFACNARKSVEELVLGFRVAWEQGTQNEQGFVKSSAVYVKDCPSDLSPDVASDPPVECREGGEGSTSGKAAIVTERASGRAKV